MDEKTETKQRISGSGLTLNRTSRPMMLRGCEYMLYCICMYIHIDA